MEFTRLPPELKSEGSMDENWRNWRQLFMIYLKASGINDWSPSRKASLLINLIGPVGQQVSNNFSPEDLDNMDVLMEKFGDHFCAKVTEAHERYIFFSSVMQHTETIDQYIATLKIRARACNFGDLMDSLIRDKIILDVKDKRLRKHLLSEPNLSLDHSINLWKMFTTTKKLTELCLPTTVADTVNKQSSSVNLDSDASNCGKCGTQHGPKHCPAHGQKCGNCGMLNHLTTYCTKPTSNNNARNAAKTPMYFKAGPFTPMPGLNKKTVYE